MDETFVIVGAGPVGTGLAQLLVHSGRRVAGLASRHFESAVRAAATAGCAALPDVDTALGLGTAVILATPDDALDALADRLPVGLRLAVHLSGARPASVLRRTGRGYRVGSLHPLANVPQADLAAERLRHCWYGIEGEAAAEAAALVAAWGGRSFTVAPESKALYHAGACMAAGYVCTLLAAAADLWRTAGVPEAVFVDALTDLSQGTVAAAGRLGPVAALTGPIRRGDVQTVRQHLASLQEHAPQWLDVYRAMARATLTLAPQRDLEVLLRNTDGT